MNYFNKCRHSFSSFSFWFHLSRPFQLFANSLLTSFTTAKLKRSAQKRSTSILEKKLTDFGLKDNLINKK